MVGVELEEAGVWRWREDGEAVLWPGALGEASGSRDLGDGSVESRATEREIWPAEFQIDRE